MPATFKPTLAHKPDADGLSDVRLRITANRVTRYFNIAGVAVAAKHWNDNATTDKENWIKASHKQAGTFNDDIAKLLTRAKALAKVQPTLDADQLKEILQRGTDLVPAQTAGPDFLAFAYASHAADDLGSFSVSTCDNRIAILNKLAAFWRWEGGSRPLTADVFTEELMDDFNTHMRRDLSNGATTRRKVFDILLLYIRRAIRKKVLPRHANPLEYYERPVPDPKQTWITDEELSAIESVRLPPMQHLARTTYLIQYYLHGSRIGVVLRLQWKQRAHGAVRFTMDKGGTEKMVPESPQLTALLDSLLPADGSPPDPEAFILPWVRDFYWRATPEKQHTEIKRATSQVNKHLGDIGTKIGMSVRLNTHTSRRALASDADDETGDLGIVQQLLGHSNRSTTERYTRGRPSRKVLAGAADVYAHRPMPELTADPAQHDKKRGGTTQVKQSLNNPER